MYYGEGIQIWVIGGFNFSAQVLPNMWPDFPQTSAFVKDHHGSPRVQSWSVLCSPLKSSVLWEASSQCGCWAPEIPPLILLLKPSSVYDVWMAIKLQWPHCNLLCDCMWCGNTAGKAMVSFRIVGEALERYNIICLVRLCYRMESTLCLCPGTKLSKGWEVLLFRNGGAP